MIILYMQMGRTIQSTSLGHSLEGSIHGETRQAQSKKTIIQMLSMYKLSSTNLLPYFNK